MRWQLIPGDPTPPAPGAEDDKYDDRIVIDEMVGDLGMTYVNDVAVFFAERNIRHGYDIKATGGCFKGPYAIKWKRIEIMIEDSAVPNGLLEHLTTLWGPAGEMLDEGDEPRLDRIE